MAGPYEERCQRQRFDAELQREWIEHWEQDCTNNIIDSKVGDKHCREYGDHQECEGRTPFKERIQYLEQEVRDASSICTKHAGKRHNNCSQHKYIPLHAFAGDFLKVKDWFTINFEGAHQDNDEHSSSDSIELLEKCSQEKAGWQNTRNEQQQDKQNNKEQDCFLVFVKRQINVLKGIFVEVFQQRNVDTKNDFTQ